MKKISLILCVIITSISALSCHSENNIQWRSNNNLIKFIGPDSVYLSSDDGQIIGHYYDNNIFSGGNVTAFSIDDDKLRLSADGVSVLFIKEKIRLNKNLIGEWARLGDMGDDYRFLDNYLFLDNGLGMFSANNPNPFRNDTKYITYSENTIYDGGKKRYKKRVISGKCGERSFLQRRNNRDSQNSKKMREMQKGSG
jgi:hypothetical protein